VPERFGNWNSVWRRFDRWAEKGRWDPILAALRDPDLDVLILDSTAVRAHPCAAGAKKNGTALAARTINRLVAAAAASAPRSTPVPTAWASPSSSS
jgi:transposase